MDPIPLKRSFDSCCTPCDPDSCPQVDLTFDKGTEPDIPESGLITFRYQRKRVVEDDVSESCTYVLKLEELTNVEGSAAPAKSKESGESAIDRILSEVTGKSAKDYD